MDDVLVIGESLVDVVVHLDGSVSEHPGGSPANVALGLARLGRTTELATRVGRDDRGQLVTRHLMSAGVRLAPGSITDAPTSTATARLDASGVAAYEFALEWSVPPDIDAGTAQAVHTGSLAALLPPGGDTVLRIVQEATGRATVSYDPNVRPALLGDARAARDRVGRFLGCADVVKASDQDLAWLAPGFPLLDVARDWLASGPALVVVTLGADGALGLTESGAVHVPASKIKVVDTVGAGDAFMAGLLDALATHDLLGAGRLTQLRHLAVERLRVILQYATQVAAITCTRAGAEPPTRAELADWTDPANRANRANPADRAATLPNAMGPDHRAD